MKEPSVLVYACKASQLSIKNKIIIFVMSSVPFVIGVTGHRDLRTEDIPELKRLISNQLTAWKDLCPHTEFFLMTSLAEGADQLCGRIAIDMGIKLLVPQPMESAEYEKDFSDTILDEYRELRNGSFSTFVVPDTELANDGSREYGYRQAGIYIARHCHVLLALWDGGKDKDGCCGTAEAVEFKIKKSYQTQGSMLKTPTEGIVLQIVTPRRSNERILSNALTVHLIENASGALNDLLKRTDSFNQDASALKSIRSGGVFQTEVTQRLGRAAESIQETYQAADTLALQYRDQYLSLLKWLSVTGSFLVLAFLFYDELEANIFLLFYGLIALIAYVVFIVAKQSRCHTKYIEYRLFAETLRVQLNLLAAGLDANAEELISWSQKTIAPWVFEAMKTNPYLIMSRPIEAEDVRSIWIQDQLNYQKHSNVKNKKKLQTQNRISSILFTITILFFFIVLATEFLFPSLIGTYIQLPDWLCRLTMSHSENFFNIRSILKILLGIIPALTLVVSSFYGKLSLERIIRDGQRMIALYSEALIAYDRPFADKKRLLKELASEELAETGDWYSYMSENRPGILI